MGEQDEHSGMKSAIAETATPMLPKSIPTYIERRIRQHAPAESQIVAGSTPVVAFGDAQRAHVATLGLNPSKAEFLDRSGKELRGTDRRLATHSSLGTSDLADAPTDVIAQALSDCNSYFKRNPYRRWFDQLNLILGHCNASYYEGTACHLDLVQWATDPTWGGLSKEIRLRLIESDIPFLMEQLANENIGILLVNGAGVIDQLKEYTDAKLDEVDRIVGYANVDSRLLVGTILGRIKIVGSSTNIQSSFGVTRELRNEIARRVGLLAHKN